jgi:hypothetical protein
MELLAVMDPASFVLVACWLVIGAILGLRWRQGAQ